jgi:phage baseplate assembly protein W
MAVERKSQSFKDISSSFKVSPLTFDLIVIKNETAISRSIRNLVYTLQGERFFQSNLGCSVSRILFENLTESTASNIQSEIDNTIRNYEPRVSLSSVDVNPNYDENAYDVVIRYDIIGIDAQPQQLTFALQPTR